MIVTREFLKQGLIGLNLTQAQANILNIEFPPRHGWIKRIIGKEISEEQANQFFIVGSCEKIRRQTLLRSRNKKRSSGIT